MGSGQARAEGWSHTPGVQSFKLKARSANKAGNLVKNISVATYYTIMQALKEKPTFIAPGFSPRPVKVPLRADDPTPSPSPSDSPLPTTPSPSARSTTRPTLFGKKGVMEQGSSPGARIR